MNWTEKTRQRDIACADGLAYSENVSVNPLAGFGSPKIGAQRAHKRVFSCPFNGGVRGEPQGSPVPIPVCQPAYPATLSIGSEGVAVLNLIGESL